MKKIAVLFLLFLTTTFFGQELYVKHYGDQKGTPILFLHGGPGYNSAGFEITTAQKLADQGFFVLLYDRRGEGRSGDVKANFTFEESFSDIDAILEKYKIKKISLMGHSFGEFWPHYMPKKIRKKYKTSFWLEHQFHFKKPLKTLSQDQKRSMKKKRIR